jgi:hypothetical protein
MPFFHQDPVPVEEKLEVVLSMNLGVVYLVVRFTVGAATMLVVATVGPVQEEKCC